MIGLMASAPPPVQPPKKSSTLWIVLIVVGAGLCLVAIIFAAILFPVFSQARQAALRTATISNAKDISLAMLMYVADNDNAMPPAFATAEDLHTATGPYWSEPLDYTSKNPDGGEFLPNSFLQGVNTMLVLEPDRAVLIYESLQWKWKNGRVVARLDGSAAFVEDFDEGAALPVEMVPEE
jgi:type II secretory pathway pseudopilin PulG